MRFAYKNGTPETIYHTTKVSLSIQVCPKKGINPTILLWGWDWDHQTYSREGYGSLGFNNQQQTTDPEKNGG